MMFPIAMRLSAAATLACLAIMVSAGEMPVKKDSFWDMTEIRKVPWDAQVISSRVEDGYRVDELYFNSEMTPNGPNRVFCAFARPEDPSRRVSLLLLLHGGGGHADAGQALFMAKTHGVAALSMDWSGEFIKGAKHYTRWRGKYPNPYEAYPTSDDMHDGPLYHITIAARRALDFAAAQPGVDMKRVAAFGGSWGGYCSLLLAGVDRRVGCVLSWYGAGGWRDSFNGLTDGLRAMPEARRTAWLARFDTLSYAATTRAAVMIVVSTNDYFFWMDGIEQNYAALAGFKRLEIQPNTDHGFGAPASLPGATDEWLKRYFKGALSWPEIIPGSFKQQGVKGRTYSWRARGTSPITRGALYWSPGSPVPSARYWIEIPARLDRGRWMAEIPAEMAGLAGKVSATAFDKEGWPGSTPGLERAGANPLTGLTPLWADGALWDMERGATAWRPLCGVSQQIESPARGVLRVTPAKGTTTISFLTNSVILTSGHAKSFSGLRLKLSGGGKEGKLSVRWLRDSRCKKEIAYSATIDYPAGEKTIELPWKAFLGPGKSTAFPCPFDGLMFEGERPGGLPLTFRAIELYH